MKQALALVPYNGTQNLYSNTLQNNVVAFKPEVEHEQNFKKINSENQKLEKKLNSEIEKLERDINKTHSKNIFRTSMGGLLLSGGAILTALSLSGNPVNYNTVSNNSQNYIASSEVSVVKPEHVMVGLGLLGSGIGVYLMGGGFCCRRCDDLGKKKKDLQYQRDILNYK